MISFRFSGYCGSGLLGLTLLFASALPVQASESPVIQLAAINAEYQIVEELYEFAVLHEVAHCFEMKRIVDAVIEIRESYNPFLYASHNTASNIRKMYPQLV